MSLHKTEQYKAYAAAASTVAKTRQVVMLYDGAIRFIKQAETAISNTCIEERFNLLMKASEIITGLQSSIDFDNGGEIANILHSFYTNISRRIISINFVNDMDQGKQQCEEIISELKQMRDVWDNIDHTLNTSPKSDSKNISQPNQTDKPPGSESSIILSA